MKKPILSRAARVLRILASALFALVSCGSWECRAADIKSVLSSPQSCHGKRVTLIGIASGDPDRFYLFANAANARALDTRHSMDVFAPADWQQKDPLTLRRVRVVGIVDANWHGHWGIIPAALRLENLQILSGPITPWPDMVAVFRNETRKPVVLHFGVPPTEQEFEVAPSKTFKVTAQEGVVRATSLEGSFIAEAKILQKAQKEFYDSRNAASYYRITDGKIESVLPSEATAWGWKR